MCPTLDELIRWVRLPKYCVLGLLILADVGCRPKNQDMLVAYVRGNFAYGVKPDTWDIGELKECENTNRAVLLDKRWDLLVCGAETQAAWEQSWLRSDLKSAIYQSATIFSVSFLSIGRSKYRGYQPRVWQCKRTSEQIMNCK